MVHRIVSDPDALASIRWPELCAALSPAQLSKVSNWLRIFLPEEAHAQIRSITYRHMTGRIARAAVTSKPDVAVTKVHGRAQVKFGVYERAVNRFALDLYKAEGFSHEPALVRYLYDAVDARTLVVDIGAHFGYFSCLVAALGGTVLAVELQRTLCQNIEANIVLNDFWRIHVFCAAIGPAPGVTQIERLDPSPGKQVTNHQFTGSTFPMNS